MKYKKPSPKDLRRANQAEILRTIYIEQPISRLEISRQTGVSPATVTNVVGGLLARRILVETGLKPSEGGRPSTLLTINPDLGYFIGAEVGETFIRIELYDVMFTRLAKMVDPLPASPISPAQLVTAIVTDIQAVLSGARVSASAILGAGFGFPGLVDPLQGVSIFSPNWGWHNIPIASMLREQLPIPLYVDNGAKAMALAEMHFGAGKSADNLTALLVGTGVGSGIITGRTLFRGTANNAGEFGHTTLNLDGPLCRCGSHGCLEVYVGAPGIIERYYRGRQPAQADQIALLHQIMEDYDQRRPEAVQAVQEVIRYLGAGIANLINITNPQLLLLGGWLGSLLGEKFLPQIRESAAQYAMEQSLAGTAIQLSQLGQEAVAMGAASLALEHFFETGGESGLV